MITAKTMLSVSVHVHARWVREREARKAEVIPLPRPFWHAAGGRARAEEEEDLFVSLIALS